jgi:FkbM family methyltransferase
MKKVMTTVYLRIARALSIFVNNPILFLEFCYFEMKKILVAFPKERPHFMRRNIQIQLDYSYDKNIREMYVGAYEISTVRIMKKFLRKGSIFVDVGANIGYFSAIGMGLVGRQGEVHSFEPVPEYFRCLKRLELLNPESRLIANQYALGDKEEKATIDLSSYDIGSNTLVTGQLDSEMKRSSFDVDVVRLDRYIEGSNLTGISLIKIDVEGYEMRVLLGLSDFFEASATKPPIICEINPDSYSLQGLSLGDLERYMNKHGYHAYNDLNMRRRVDITRLRKLTNVVFIAQDAG